MPGFFGLTSNDKEIFMEPIFILVYYMGMTYREAYTLPIWQRRWYIERVVEEIKKSNGQSKGNDQNQRAWSQKTRQQGPQRTKRFS